MIDDLRPFDEFEVCPCCRGGVDILMDMGMTCELCYTAGEVEGFEARHYEKQVEVQEAARKKVDSGGATALDLLTAGALAVNIRV